MLLVIGINDKSFTKVPSNGGPHGKKDHQYTWFSKGFKKWLLNNSSSLMDKEQIMEISLQLNKLEQSLLFRMGGNSEYFQDVGKTFIFRIKLNTQDGISF